MEMKLVKGILKYVKKIIPVIIIISSLFSITAGAESYVYNYEGEALRTPDAVTVKYYADSAYSGFSVLSEPRDMDFDAAGNLYIADTDNNRIVVLDRYYKFVNEYRSVTLSDGSKSDFSEPTGIYCCKNGTIYIADSKNGRILVADCDFNLINTVTATAEEVLKESFVFTPLKVSASTDGRIYAIADGVYDGLMEFDASGKFVSFSGAAKVTYNLFDKLWMKYGTEKQRKQRTKNIPTEFSNLDIDSEGFVYTVNASVKQSDPYSSEPIRKQNNLGTNILKTTDELKNPIGDILYPYSKSDASVTGPSKLIDISAAADYGYVVADEKRGHIFVYSSSGEIMFVFGGSGSNIGTFTLPVAVSCYGSEIAVLDGITGSVTVFTFTEYADLIISATENYHNGKYDESYEEWQQVLKTNSNLNTAYVNIGKILIRKGEYKKALDYLKLGQNKAYYSKAYKYYRKEILKNNLIWILLGIAAVLSIVIAAVHFLFKGVNTRLNSKRWFSGLKYSFHIMAHPFDGFWDMTHENKGSMSAALILYAFFTVSVVVRTACRGFLLSPLGGNANLPAAVALSIIPILLYCVCNWSITTLFDGDGKFSQIYMGCAYCLTPYLLVSVPITVIGNFVTLEETAILNVISAFAIIWCVFLLFCAMVTVHGYSGSKAIVTIIATVVAMLLVIMLVVLLFNLVRQMVMFVISIYDELTINL